MYKTLNDCRLFPAGDEIEIWYTKRSASHLRFGTMMAPIEIKDINETHIRLGTMSAAQFGGLPNMSVCERMFYDLQAEIWSDDLQANNLVRSLGIHTSMSVGDIVVFRSDPGVFYFCDNFGFKRIEFATH